MSGIDLHSHTTYSDGTFAPAETVKLALERGLDVLAVSDHDTTEGLAEVADAARGTGLEIVPATEFSTVYEGGSIHVLAYWIDLGDAEFQAELARLQDDREWRAQEIVNKLNEMGHAIDYARVRELAGGSVVARPHIAQAMVEAGIVPTYEEAFTEDFILDGGRAYVEKHALHPVDALALIHRAGGVCVIAHPGMWSDADPVPDALIERMAEEGLDGIEADHPDHPEETRERYRQMAGRFGIPFTGSSDCHGTRYDPVRLGTVTTHAGEFAKLKARAGR
jgi:predicted metal-dependent phosphoesterase TrpH